MNKELDELLKEAPTLTFEPFPQKKEEVASAPTAEATPKEEKIEVVPLKTKYPQGGERFLISAVTGKEINSSMLPADAGCVVDNISTMIAIHDAVVYEKPLTHRVVTISGDAITTPSNFLVPLGTYVEELLETRDKELYD